MINTTTHNPTEKEAVPDNTSKMPLPTPTVSTPPEPPAIKRISDDDLFRSSSQYRIWSFTKEQLKEKREQLSSKVSALVREKIERFLAENNSQLSNEEINEIRNKAIPVNAAEELQLITLYAQKIQLFGNKLRLPTEVVATAVCFFKKFYLETSVMEIHPKEMFFTCLFFACKSENYFIGIDSFASKVKKPKDSILKHEFRLLEGLKFTLMNHHPYKALHGFFLDIQMVLMKKVDLNYLGKVYENCKNMLNASLLTETMYHYTPPQITLAVLLTEDEALCLKYLEVKFPKTAESSNSVGLYEKVVKIIRECQKDLSVSYIPSKEVAVNIAAKVHYCDDPMVVVKRLKRKRDQQEENATSIDKQQKSS
ncbi:related to Cyclin CCL1 [Saccharomycodes ludwigii]|uniref:Related to Cyclin CCL1 n=1 Tax=Saccharomycodes ludwigii TaxID=36035 RepID=A0A376B223_9ASCO|nr:hypothetical protein SCDLUD_000134 [Saccharomycodes ludwigii]KAH3902554.1 hypothetical protein SCDLUD_000134 [Saccharomycodes ludwigii]SSD58735.1 related to Cyclin CCL1 [Saccharomycodes ludwigii]